MTGGGSSLGIRVGTRGSAKFETISREGCWLGRVGPPAGGDLAVDPAVVTASWTFERVAPSKHKSEK